MKTKEVCRSPMGHSKLLQQYFSGGFRSLLKSQEKSLLFNVVGGRGGVYRARSMTVKRAKCHVPRCVVAVVTDAMARDTSPRGLGTSCGQGGQTSRLWIHEITFHALSGNKV